MYYVNECPHKCSTRVCVWECSSPSSITVYSNRQQLWMLAKQKQERSKLKTFIYTHTHPIFTPSPSIHSEQQFSQHYNHNTPTQTHTDTSINQQFAVSSPLPVCPTGFVMMLPRTAALSGSGTVASVGSCGAAVLLMLHSGNNLN